MGGGWLAGSVILKHKASFVSHLLGAQLCPHSLPTCNAFSLALGGFTQEQWVILIINLIGSSNRPT